MIFSLRARGCANCVGFYTIPYIRAHILGVGSANARKRHRSMPERISSCTRSPHRQWPLDGKYLYFLSIWLNIIALNPIRQYFSLIRFLAVGWNIESVNLPDEEVNLWIFTVGLTLSGCRPHTSSVWPFSGVPKVRVYDTFLDGLHQKLITKGKAGRALSKAKSNLKCKASGGLTSQIPKKGCSDKFCQC
jgi:hypothetical protein